MTPTTRQRHLKFGRFERSSSVGREAGPDSPHVRRRGRWTGYRPLSDAVTQARLAALTESTNASTEEKP